MQLVKGIAGAALVLATAAPAVLAQALGVPSNLAQYELERSRACVPLLARVDSLNQSMAPLAERSRRLDRIAEAVALEDASIVDSLNASVRIEARVAEWFRTDAELARRLVNQPDPQVAAERSAGRETIKAALGTAIAEVQTEATETLSENQELLGQAGRCDGAIFVRSAVSEACAASSGGLCDEAALPASEARRFRFVDDPASIWEIEELRPWTRPTPLRPGPGGQLDGARTIGFARVGNVIVSVAFQPLFRPRAQTPPELVAAYQATNDSLGLSFDHPDVAFTPSLGIRVALPQALGEEDGYVLHFGSPEEADVVWTGDANTGRPLEATVALAPSHVQRLAQGDPLTLTAIDQPDVEGEAPSAGYAIVVGNVNQAPATQALLGYMAEQLSADFTAMAPPRGTP